MKIISKNKKATFNYFLEEEIEAGLVLRGDEVKSIREGKVSISESYVIIIKSEVFIMNMDISEYKNINKGQTRKLVYNSKRNRKLLLHKSQIKKFIGKLNKSGLTLIPTVLYFNPKNKIKIKIALAKGKKMFDKRKDIKEKDAKRENRKFSEL